MVVFNGTDELAKIKFFDVKPDLTSLKENEKEALMLCVEASKLLNGLYQIQLCGDNLENYLEILREQNNPDLERFFQINAGPWNRFGSDAPFLPDIGEKPITAGFYPEDLTKEEWNSWLEQHPEDRKSFESNTTMIRRQNGDLVAIPYHEFFKGELMQANRLLSDASKKLEPSPLSTYLTEISKSLLTGNYYDSDVAFVKTTGFPFEVIFGPIENYDDELFNFKSRFESYIGVPDKEATENLEIFKKYIPEFDAILAKKFGYKQKGSLAPMAVYNDVLRAGAVGFGRQFTASNLPNDREIHEKYGSKKTFSKTMVEAKTNNLITKIAERILPPEDLRLYDGNTRILFILGHEIAHGMGPGIIERNGQRISLEGLLQETNLPLEEAKADALGLTFLNYLTGKRILTEDNLKSIFLTDFVGNFVNWRIGFKEAHSKSPLIGYNYLKGNGVVSYNENSGTFSINYNKAFSAYEKLAYDVMKIQNSGDYEAAKRFLKQNTKVHPEIKEILESLTNIPIEVFPVFKI